MGGITENFAIIWIILIVLAEIGVLVAAIAFGVLAAKKLSRKKRHRK